MSSLNNLLDSLPASRLTCGGREAPTYRACGVAGFYVAVIVVFGGGLLTGRSLLVIALLALVCGLSFFVYAYLRKWIAGYEEIVLLEHVWFAFACVSATLWALGQPVLPYLDVVSPALCFFLAAGRIGCTLVGCCHGHPSSLGITYTDKCAIDGFPRHLVGVRLFPVPAIEAAGLFAIGVIGLIALPFAQPGRVFAWFLLAYSVMRFGLEGIRADRRPHFLSLSQARWMAIIEVALALRLTEDVHRVSSMAVYAPLFATLIVVLAYRWRTDWRRRLLRAEHVREVRELARGEIGSLAHPAMPVSLATSQRVTLAVSRAGSNLQQAHISLALPDGRGDLELLCALASRAFPELVVEAAQLTSGRVIHLHAPMALTDFDTSAEAREWLAQELYGYVARRLQKANERPPAFTNEVREVHEADTRPSVPHVTSIDRLASANAGNGARSWYFASARNKTQ